MESILNGIPGVVVYIDDILITAVSESEHLSVLDEVLKRIEESGLRLKKSKCVFLVPSIEYIGYVIDEKGLHPTQEKVRAVQDAPRPTNVTELKSYLGLLTYYYRFLRNLSTVLAPLNQLLRHQEPWCWTDEQEKAFKESKELLLSSQVLAHFDPSLEIIVACDASDYGIGAVLSHKMPNGSERPVAFMSRTLNRTERKYSQIEKEGLACVVGVIRFHSYLYGHHFVLQTDHKPLLSFLSENKLIPQQADNRIQRWSWKLASDEYTIEWRASKQHANADALSRLPLPEAPAETVVPAELVLMVENMAEVPISAKQIASWTLS